MINSPLLNNHAIKRLQERFDVDKEWLLNELENGRFVWLKGCGNCGHLRKIRSGYLFYIPNKDEYCVVVMDNRSRLGITVLTEEMALNSSWGKGLNEAEKLRAKRIALGEKVIDGSYFLRLYAEERGQLSVSVRARTISNDWKPITLSIYKTSIKCEQIDTGKKICRLEDDQMNEVSKIIKHKIEVKEIRPYCELYVSTGNNNIVALLANTIDEIYPIHEAENARRWA